MNVPGPSAQSFNPEGAIASRAAIPAIQLPTPNLHWKLKNRLNCWVKCAISSLQPQEFLAGEIANRNSIKSVIHF